MPTSPPVPTPRPRIVSATIASLALAGGLLAALCAPSTGLAAETTAGGAAGLVADTGFRPKTDGYGFPNYGDDPGIRDLTSVEMRQLFGQRICSSTRGGPGCLLNPVAGQALRQFNGQMDGGHCMGFAVTAQSFFDGVGSPAQFGSPTVPGLELEGNPSLQSHIAYGFTYQFLPRVQRNAVEGSPRKVLRKMRASLRTGREAYVLAFFKKDMSGGHAITPFAIKKRAPGRFAIRVYDNNYPGRKRSFMVNTKRNRWSYEASINPSVESDRYVGNAKSKTLTLLPVKPGVGRQPCFFCGGQAKAGAGGSNAPGATRRGDLHLLWNGDPRTGEHGDLMVSDAQGRRTGCDADGGPACVNRIPGAEMQHTVLGGEAVWRKSPPPVFRLPGGRRYEVALTGGSLTEGATESVGVIGRDLSLAVSDVRLRPGERDRIGISGDGHTLIFDNDRHQVETPKIELSTVGGAADYGFRIKARNVARGATVRFSLDPDRRRLVIDARDATGHGRYALRMARYTAGGRETFTRRVKLRSGSRAIIEYGRTLGRPSTEPAG